MWKEENNLQTIRIKQDVWKKLNELKYKLGIKTQSDLIMFLMKNMLTEDK